MEAIPELEKEIQLYQSALQSLENGCDNDDYDEMKNTFSTIIAEKSQQLLETKKLFLLSSLDEIEKEIKTAEIKSVLFRCYNGTIIKRNITIDEIIENEALFYFKNPLYPSEIKCPHVALEKCNYEDNCRYSHGTLIETEDLNDPVDDNIFDVNDNCYVLDDATSLWRAGKILHIDREQPANCVVELKQMLNKSSKDENVISVDLDNVIKEVIADFDEEYEDEDEDNLILDEDLNDIQEKITSEEIITNNDVKLISDKFGSWEKHTKGIGLKLMMQMGYEVGKGLGAKGQGRVEPVEVASDKKGNIIKKRRPKRNNKRNQSDKPQLKPGSKEYNKNSVIRNELELKRLYDDLLRAQRQQELYAMDLVQTNIWQSRINRIKQKIDMIKVEDKKLVEGTTNTMKIDKKRAF